MEAKKQISSACIALRQYDASRDEKRMDMKEQRKERDIR